MRTKTFTRQKTAEEIGLKSKLEFFLDSKPLYYDKIDYERFPNIFNSIKDKLILPKKIIHIIGTNGKGTTGRFIATALRKAGYKTGHYTSPHIFRFNERVWINGKDITNEELDSAFFELEKILTKEQSDALSYFEYTTLISMVCFRECDFVVLEAGLGGEYDATAVFEKILTVVTPIDFDHQDFLGDTIEKIATTKLNAISKNVVLSKQPHKEVYEIAKDIALKKCSKIYFPDFRYDGNMPKYMYENLSTAKKALDVLGIEYNDEYFEDVKMFGRLSEISKNIIIDVGHNPLSAKAVCDALYPKKYTLVYNSFKDKDYETILKILKPIISNVEIIAINSQRIAQIDKIKKVLNNLNVKYENFKNKKKKKNYLVYGSFKVVEEFLKKIDGESLYDNYNR